MEEKKYDLIEDISIQNAENGDIIVLINKSILITYTPEISKCYWQIEDGVELDEEAASKIEETINQFFDMLENEMEEN